jgi:ABC-type nitrate/sulfonate/bicarbonate transport system substrate-binding protein
MALALVAVGLLIGCSAGPSASSRQPASAPAAPSGGPPSAAASGTGATQAPTPLKTRSAYTTIAASVAPWWAAQEAGYFREQGLDLELIHTDAGAPLLAALTNKELDVVSAGGTSLVLGNLQGVETMIIGSTANFLDSSIFVREGIQSVEDMRGKTIGVTNLKAISDTAARLAMRHVGLEPDVDVFTRRTGGLAESLAGIETGTLDGASISVPVVFEARKRGYRELLSVAAMRLPFLIGAVGATKTVLNERPELGERYLRALAQGVSRLKTDREFAIEAIGKYTRLEDPELLGATVDYYRPLWPSDPYPERDMVQAVLDEEDNPAARTTRPEDVADMRFADALRRSGFLERLPK